MLMRRNLAMRSGLILPLAVLLLISCVRPASEEYFVKASEAVDGIYSFSLDFSDSLSLYDISLFSAAECPGMELKLLWSGPDGELFSETAYMTGSSACELYRKDVSMENPGTWKLDIRVSGEPEDFRGLGILSKRHGTR